MAENSFLYALLTTYAYQVPLYLAWFVAMVLALVFMGRHPGVSWLVLAAMSLFFLQSLAGTFLHQWMLFRVREERGWSHIELATAFSVLGIVRTLVSTLAWALLLFAVFGWRRQAVFVRLPEALERAPGPPDTAIRE